VKWFRHLFWLLSIPLILLCSKRSVNAVRPVDTDVIVGEWTAFSSYRPTFPLRFSACRSAWSVNFKCDLCACRSRFAQVSRCKCTIASHISVRRSTKTRRYRSWWSSWQGDRGVVFVYPSDRWNQSKRRWSLFPGMLGASFAISGGTHVIL
jgi:hypothetical protein